MRWLLMSAIGSVFTAVVLKNPAAVIGVIAAGGFALLVELAASNDYAGRLLGRRWPRRARALDWLVNVGASVLALWGVWLDTHGVLERLLWNTGAFGESPSNRTVIAREVPGVDGQGSAWLVEWRVERWRTDGAYASARFDADMTDAWDWFGPPGMTEPLGKDEAVGLGPRIYSRMKEACCAGARFDSEDVTPSDSYYFLAVFDRHTALLDCYFGDATEQDVPGRVCKDGNVRLLASHSR
jgi:hypothetical protein